MMQNGKPDTNAPMMEVDTNVYPELHDCEPGDPVSGTFEGRVESVTGGKATISCGKMDLQSGNPADKALEKMTGKKFGRPQGKSAPQSNVSDEGDDY